MLTLRYQVTYCCFNAENGDPRRSGRQKITDWIDKYPDTNVAVIISAHSSDKGLLAHAYQAPQSAKTPTKADETLTPWDLTPSEVSAVKILC